MRCSITFVLMIKATVNGTITLELAQKGGKTVINGKEQSFDLKTLKPGTYHLLVEGRSYTIDVVSSDKTEKKHELIINGKKVNVQLRDRYDDLLHELGLDAVAGARVGDLKAPMPGLVVDIPVSEGQRVMKGDTLLILEAMKMENTLKAIVDATIKKIVVKKGQAVDKNEVLIQLV
ncbi:acetyl-CoA carboxylase biotin carboxyl carrier protein subunit [soil metagenome]